MSEPVKKPGHAPESYTPKKPEIVGMVEQAQKKPAAVIAYRMTAPHTFETERLIIRRFRQEDWRGLQEIGISNNASECADFDHEWPADVKGAKKMCKGCVKHEGCWAVEVKNISKVVCIVVFNGMSDANEMDIGHVTNGVYFEHGYDYEALAVLYDHCFRHERPDAITAGWTMENKQKLAPLVKLGMELHSGGIVKAFRGDRTAEGCGAVITRETWEHNNPTSYDPRKPEIVGMVEDAQANAEQITAQQAQGGTSMNPTNYGFCFSPFRSLDFTNCFASLFMFLEGFEGDADVRKEQQSRLFFLFDTVSGRSAAARGWGNQATDIYREIYDSDDMVDFLMGYTGYGYAKYSDSFAQHIQASLAMGLPVLTRLKKAGEYMDDTGDSFRLITGYSGGKLQMPEPKGAQKPPKKAPKLNEIESIYVITGKTQRKYTLLDGLKRIRRVMDADRETGVWDDYIKAFECSWDWLNDISLKDLKALFKRAHKGTTWNCHNFAAPFRTHEYLDSTPEHYQNWIWDELKDPRFGQPRPVPNRPEDDPLRLPAKQLIDWACDMSHNRQWSIHALYEIRDWSKKYYIQLEWANCENAMLLLQKLKEYDGYIYAAVCGMIEVLEGDNG